MNDGTLGTAAIFWKWQYFQERVIGRFNFLFMDCMKLALREIRSNRRVGSVVCAGSVVRGDPFFPRAPAFWRVQGSTLPAFATEIVVAEASEGTLSRFRNLVEPRGMDSSNPIHIG